jgi:hypothetical protein
MQAMTRTLISLWMMLLSSLVFAAGQEADPVRTFADSMAQLIVAKQDDSLYEHMAPQVRRAYSREVLLAPLSLARSLFGDIQSFEYKQAMVGEMTVPGATIKTATIWYAVATSKYPTGRFLQIRVSYDAGQYYLAQYMVSQFVGDSIPEALRDKPSP